MSNGMKITLNMIVRDESHCILECLESVRDLITDYVICDTGSTDSTIEVIKQWGEQHSITGTVIEEEWIDFGHNRNLALQAAQMWGAEYVMIMDADDYLVGTPNLEPGYDSYVFQLESSAKKWRRRQIVRLDTGLPWQWYDKIHEYLSCKDQPFKETWATDCTIQTRGIGGRGQHTGRFEQDTTLLLKQWKEAPSSRTAMMLARTYYPKHPYDARKWNDRHLALAEWPEEEFSALLMAGQITRELGGDPTSDYLRAYEFNPERAEPLYELAGWLMQEKRYHLALIYLRAAMGLSEPPTALGIDKHLYEWKILDRLAQCCWHCSLRDEAKVLYTRELQVAPESEQERITKNLQVC